MHKFGKSVSDIESADWSEPPCSMVLQAKGPTPTRESVVRVTTTVEVY